MPCLSPQKMKELRMRLCAGIDGVVVFFPVFFLLTADLKGGRFLWCTNVVRGLA
jgi:hypothetical protein